MNEQEPERTPIWRTPAGRDRLIEWYERFLSKVDAPIDRQTVPTRFGPSHLLAIGSESTPPLLCLHGMRTGSSFLLSELTHLSTRFRLIAPDMPGQSICGPEIKLSLNDNSYADWLIDVIDELGLPTAHLLGVSWGAFVARLLASREPDRVATLSMLTPAGIANGSHLVGLAKMTIPWISYKLRPTEARLRSLLRPILTTWDADWAGAFACALADMRIDPRVPPIATDDELRNLHVPTLVIAGEDDISFPGRAVVDRVTGLIPQVETELLNGCRHCPPTTDAFRCWLASRLTRFILTTTESPASDAPTSRRSFVASPDPAPACSENPLRSTFGRQAFSRPQTAG